MKLSFAATSLLCAGMLLSTAVSAAELTGTLKKIHDTGSITLGYREASVPFSYLLADGKPTGYAFEVCQAVGEAVKKGRYNDRSFCRCLEEKTAEMGLTTEDIQPLLLLGTRLGTTDVEGQLSMLKLCRCQLDEVREREAQHCKKTGKMYISLGLCVGIGAAIFLA